MTTQARNTQALIDHIQDQDRIIRQRNEQIREQVKIIKSLRRELEEAERSPSVDFEVLWWNTETEREKQEARAERAEKRAEKAGRERDEARSRLAEATKEIREQGATIAELAAESHPLTPEDITDGMVERGAERLREVIDSGFSPRASWAVRRALTAALAEPLARPEGAERLESQIEAWDHEYGDDAIMTAPRLRELADFLSSRGVRFATEERS